MQPSSRRFGKLIFGGFAVLFGLLGLLVLAFRDTLGLEMGEAGVNAAALLLTAGADVLILMRWDRLSPAKAEG